MKRDSSKNLSTSAGKGDALSRQYVPQQVIPSTVDPIQMIEAEGNAYRNLKDGNAPWWVILSSWLFIALPMALAIFGLFYTVVVEELKQPVEKRGPGIFVLLTFFSLLPGSLIYIVARGSLNKYRKSHRPHATNLQPPKSWLKSEHWRRLRASQQAVLTSGREVKATLIMNEAHRTLRYDATICIKENIYQLRIRQFEEDNSKSCTEADFTTWEELAWHLEKYTFFLIQDFKSS
jgi:hypothetical protein